MNGWRKENLECVCEILDTLRKPITKRDRTTGKYPYYGATGIVDYVADYIFDEKLVLVGEDGAKWASGETTAFIAEGKYWVNNHAHVLRPSKNVILHEWLSYYLTHLDLSPFVGGLTVPKLNQGNLKLIPVSFPSLPEQKRIVEILDEAFDGIAKATANAQRNRASAEDLFEGFLANFFSRKEKNWKDVHLKSICERITVGHVGSMAKRYVSGGIPFLRSQNIRPFCLDLENVIYIDQTFHSELKKSSLKAGDVAIVRTGYPGTAAVIPNDLGPANCSDLVIVRPNDMVLPDFLASFFNSSFGKASVGGRLVGAAQKHFNVSAAKETILHLPPLDTQKEFTQKVEELKKEASRLEENYLHKVSVLNEIKTALLHKAFTGQLTSSSVVPAVQKLESPMTANAKLTAQVIVLAHYRHVAAQRDQTFGHVKAQKILHLVESCANISLARSPVKDAAGPNDFAHMLRAEEWAESNGFFKFNQRDGGYSFQKLKGYNQLLSEAQERLKPFKQKLDKILGLLVPMDTQEAEVFATVHAAWNNLVVDRKPITDDAIIKEARDNWHQDKLKIPKAKFLKAIHLIRKEGLIPDGSAKYVPSHPQGKML